jgi:SAM-dependent methyltransferase
MWLRAEGRTATSSLNDNEKAVGEHYDGAAYEFERTRLEEAHPMERAMTERYLRRFVPEGSVVADIGVGAGHYDELLARRGCQLFLVDISERLLETALARLEACRLHGQVIHAWVASATDLGHLSTGSCDVVLLLGPLYHLLSLSEREQAVYEARRVLKRDGVLIAAACNRLAALATEYFYFGEQERGAERLAFNQRFIADGIVDPEVAPTIGHAHFTSAEEFRALFAHGFEALLFAGIESFTGSRQGLFLGHTEEAQRAWLDLVEQTATQAEAIGMSEHFLYVGRRA